MRWHGLQFETNNREVYPPKPATLFFAHIVSKTVRPGNNFLEVGTGSGAIAIAVAKCVRGAKVTASDINGEAIQVTKSNAKLNGVAVKTVLGDLFKPFKPHSFDVIAIHPPAVPYPLHATWGLTKGMTVATNGGPDGSQLIVQSITQAVKFLKSEGILLLMLPHWSNTKKAYQTLLRTYSAISMLGEIEVQFFPATEGKPTKALLRHVEILSKNGTIELYRKNKKLYSKVSVIQAIR